MNISYDWDEAVSWLCAADSRIAPHLCHRPKPPQADPEDLFSALLTPIVSQQLSTRAAATIGQRLNALLPAQGRAAAYLKLGEAQVRGAGLSGAKYRALLDLAERVLNGQLPSLRACADLDDQALEACLVQVRGVGPWTAQMFLMFALGRPDVLPLGDLGVRKGLGVMLGAAEPFPSEVLQAEAEAWRPYRSVVAWHCWRVLENQPKR